MLRETAADALQEADRAVAGTRNSGDGSVAGEEVDQPTDAADAALEAWNQAPAERQTPWRACCRETGTAGSASGLGKRARSNPGTAPQADSTMARHHCPNLLGQEPAARNIGGSSRNRHIDSGDLWV